MSSVVFSLCLVLVGLPVPANAQPLSLSVASAATAPGATVSLDLVLTSGTTAPAALQWTVGYPVNAIASVSVVAGPAASAAGKSLICNSLAGAITCVLYGLNGTAISSGVVATARVAVLASAAASSIAISLYGGAASDGSGSAILPFTTTGGTLSLPQAPSTQVVATNPPGLSFVVDGVPYSASQSFQWPPGSTHSIGVPSPQGASGTRYTFLNWSDAGAATHNIVVAPVATTYTANFLTSYLLQTAPDPSASGAIRVSPPSADGYYPRNSLVQLTAIPHSGYQFITGDADWIGADNPTVLAMNAPKIALGVFVASSTCTFTLSRAAFTAAPEGDLARVDINTTEGCPWTASTTDPWISVTSTSGAAGPGAVRFSVAPNPSITPRVSMITIANQTLQVQQGSVGCLPSPATAPALLAAGGSTSLPLSLPSACQWFASSAPRWLSFPNAQSGTGPGTLPLAAEPNPSLAPRPASASVNGFIYPLVQAAVSPSSSFTDVALDHPYRDAITLLRLYGITSGCTLTEFCPDAPTTRGQMAVFLIRALLSGDTFPYPATPFFDDVPPSHPYFSYIQKMRELGITVGCAPTQYCPSDPVTRWQMAVFLIRCRFGISSTQTFPFPAAAYFDDVPSTRDTFPYIQKLRESGITTGCSATFYCPDATTTRGQMAVFLIRTFFTP